MTITVEHHGPRFVLMASDGKTSPAPCGARLFRGPPIPDIKFSHVSQHTAEIDAAKLRAYIAEHYTKKQSKKELRNEPT